jgi:site-specific DNA-methyltransferase (adenine-specific)
MTNIYYQNEAATLYDGDCLEILSTLPEKSVDMIFADPPYNLSNGGITCHAGRMVSVNKGVWDKSNGIEIDHEFTIRWLSECHRLLKDNGTIWVSGTRHSIFSVGFAMQKLGYKLLNEIAWFKPNAAPNLSCRYFTHSHETIIWAAKNGKSKHKFNYKLMKEKAGGKQMRSLWIISTPGKNEKTFGKHPTQKPLALLELIVLASTDPGSVVLDPFTGSSTTGVVSLRHNRIFIGIDNQKEYLELSVKRIEEEMAKKRFDLLA